MVAEIWVIFGGNTGNFGGNAGNAGGGQGQQGIDSLMQQHMKEIMTNMRSESQDQPETSNQPMDWTRVRQVRHYFVAIKK